MLESPYIEPNLMDANGNTLLHAIRGPVENIQVVIDDGKFPLDMKNARGNTPLAEAARKGNEVVAKLLLRTGRVSLDIGNNGHTPLMIAIRSRSPKPEPVARLLHAGHEDDVRRKTSRGESPATLVEQFENVTDEDICTMVQLYDKDRGRALLEWYSSNNREKPSVTLLETNDEEAWEELFEGGVVCCWPKNPVTAMKVTEMNLVGRAL